MNLFLRVVVVSWMLGSTALAAALPVWTGDPVRGAAELEKLWPQIADANRSLGIRGTLRFALEAAGLAWHPERVEAALVRARAMQDLDPASATRGNFRWRSDQPRVLDRNGVEFATQLAALLRLRYAANLTAGGRAALDALLTDAIDGLRGHEVKIEYTNIFVMKAWGLIATGEALGRPEVASDGYARFDAWLRFTARHGIAEYGAVTYYGVDLDSLALIAKFAGRPDARAQAEAAIRYLWTDIAANWWKPGDRLGGTNARSYDYLYGGGYLEAHTWTAGWLRHRPQLEGAGWLSGAHDNLTVLRDLVAIPPPAEWTEPIRTQLPRIVVQRWGNGPEQRAVNWVGHHVSLASSGASHGSDERTLVANLGDSPAVPQLTLFMDGRGDPFGSKKIANAANQAKALHLTPFIATVQRGAEVLQLLSEEPLGPNAKRPAGALTCFLTHLTLPAQAEIWIDRKTVAPGTPDAPKVIPPGATISVRLGGGVIGIRFLLATATDGGSAQIHYIEDSPRSVARRLTVVHSATSPKGRGSVVVWLRATEGLDATQLEAWQNTFAAARGTVQRSGANVITAEVAGLAGPLHIEANIEKAERLTLTGGEPDALLSVNGRDVGHELLGAYESR